MEMNCAGIVLYNPDINRLKENFEAIANQVRTVILVDNKSDNIIEIESLFDTKKNIILIKNKKNHGIAKALNQICSEAKSLDYDWVYLLDQDSISSPSIIKSYAEYVSLPQLALITPFIIDTNKFDLSKYKRINMPKTVEVRWAITSGSLINLSVWEKVGKFFEELFIDSVDIDYSTRLNIEGYKQIRVNSEYLLQEVGNAEKTMLVRPHKDNSGKWSLKRYYKSNHSLIRQYYMIRNNVILAKKYRKHQNILKSIIFIILFALSKVIFEKRKLKLFIIVISGLKDGMKFKIDCY